MRSLNLFGLILVLAVAFPLSTQAQTVELEVKDDSGSVKLKAGTKGVSVKTGEASLEVKDGKVSIAIGRRAKKVKLSKSKPITLKCDGNEEKTLRNLYIVDKRGDGLKLEGNCELTLIDSYIEVTGYAIRASGNAEVKLINSTLIGTKGAVFACDNAEVEAIGSVTEGKIVTEDNGEFEDKK